MENDELRKIREIFKKYYTTEGVIPTGRGNVQGIYVRKQKYPAELPILVTEEIGWGSEGELEVKYCIFLERKRDKRKIITEGIYALVLTSLSLYTMFITQSTLLGILGAGGLTASCLLIDHITKKINPYIIIEGEEAKEYLEKMYKKLI